MSSLFKKIIKKQDMISDHGVHQKTNIVDVFVVILCSLASIALIYLGIMVFVTY